MNPDSQTDFAGLVLFGPPDPAECRAAAEVAAQFARVAPPVGPPPAVRERLLAAVAPSPSSLPYIQTAAEGVWEPTPVPGLVRRVLFQDHRAARITVLLRLAPGARVPAHSHPGTEELLVLEGDLRLAGGPVLRTGDFQRSEAGSLHVEQWSENGCLALLVGPLLSPTRSGTFN